MRPSLDPRHRVGGEVALPVPPHHRTYYARIRRFQHWLSDVWRCTRETSPKRSNQARPMAAFAPGVWLMAHHPREQDAVAQAEDSGAPQPIRNVAMPLARFACLM